MDLIPKSFTPLRIRVDLCLISGEEFTQFEMHMLFVTQARPRIRCLSNPARLNGSPMPALSTLVELFSQAKEIWLWAPH
eukprot:10719378-Heterocapsa_arctica.AAC.1